ncbi:pentapeptide repeat-containing protein [Nonomuraea sp. NPDC055795]
MTGRAFRPAAPYRPDGSHDRSALRVSHALASGPGRENVTPPSPQFPRADLSRAALNGTDLRSAVLVGANLVETSLSGADLSGATRRP